MTIRRVFTLVACGWVISLAPTTARADEWTAPESFAELAGYDSPIGFDVQQLAAIPGYGAFPQLARTDPTTILPQDNASQAPVERPLGLIDAQLYQQIFAAQEAGDLAVADGLIQQLDDTILIGHVVHQRLMHPTAHRASYAELADWLRLYHDHAGAAEVYQLALSRQTAGAPAPTAPTVSDTLANSGGGSTSSQQPLPIDIARGAEGDRAARGVLRTIRGHLRDEDRSAALATLAGAGGVLASAESAEARGTIAFNAVLNSSDQEALELAAAAVAQAGAAAPSALWAGGLAAWRVGDYPLARERFEMLADSVHASRRTRAAGAYWAARACVRQRAPADVSALLRRAAQHPDTFYGMLAQHALGMNDPRQWTEPNANADTFSQVLSRPAARRGLALLQIGETARGEAEFRVLATLLSGGEMRALLAFAAESDMPGLALRLSVAHAERSGEQVWAARYPAPDWIPASGLQLDRAVMLAIVRQESAFNATAVSSAGARGLMQLMPRTARAMADLVGSPGAGEITDTATNLALGQQFVQELRSYGWIGDDLFKILAAYNGGPGNLTRWMERADYGNDPLLFIETIRAGETRDYVKRVMANLWAYRLRFGQPTPELDDLIAGRWPLYQNLNARIGVAALPD